jgi:hypothetical protein
VLLQPGKRLATGPLQRLPLFLDLALQVLDLGVQLGHARRVATPGGLALLAHRGVQLLLVRQDRVAHGFELVRRHPLAGLVILKDPVE